MRALLVALLVLTTSAATAAVKMECGGKITTVMAGHFSCEGYVAFKTEKSPSRWMCSKSKDADSAILAGFMADKKTTVQIDGTDLTTQTCEGLNTYRKIDYIMLIK